MVSYLQMRAGRINRGQTLFGAVCSLVVAAVALGSSQALAEPMKLSLEQAIEGAISTSPRLEQSKASLEAQTEKRRGSWLDLGPKVYGEYTQTKTDDFEAKAASLTATQPITGLFGLTKKGQYEGLNEDIAAATLEITRLEIAYGTAEQYLGAQQATKQVEIATAYVATAEKQRADGEALAKAGRINRDELLRLDLELSRARATLAKGVAARDIALMNLGQAVGLKGQEIKVDPFNKVDPSKVAIPDVAAATTEAIQNRIEFDQAKRGVRAAGFGKDLAYTYYIPSIDVFSKWDRQYGDRTPQQKEKSQTVGVKVSWLLWDNGSKIFAIREASSQERAAEAQIQSVEQTVRSQVFAAVTNLKASQSTLALATAAAGKADESHRISQERFRAGAISITDLLIAQANKVQSEGDVLSAQVEFRLQTFALDKALGKRRPNI